MATMWSRCRCWARGPIRKSGGTCVPDLRNYLVIPGCASWRRPGIHTPDGGYGFRARSLRSRPGMTLRLNQPAAVGDAAEMVIGVAEGVFDHGQPLEVVADLGLLGHADAAMELAR